MADPIVVFKVPAYDPAVDYQYLYSKMFHQNETRLQAYDTLLAERARLYELYQKMQSGDFSHLPADRVLAHQSKQKIFQTFVVEMKKPGDAEDEDAETKSRKR